MKTKFTTKLKKLLPAAAIVAGSLVTLNSTAQISTQNVQAYQPMAGASYNGDLLFNVTVFPIPTQNILTLKAYVNESANMTLTVRNILGSAVFERSELVTPGVYQHDFDLSDLPNGLYLVEIKSGNQVITQRIIKD